MTQHQFTIRKEGTRVMWLLGGRRITDFGWHAGDELASAIRRVANGEEERVLVRGACLQLGAPGMMVLSVDGKVVTDGHVDEWRAIARATTAKCRLIEEEEKAEQIAFDGALMLRVGAPIGFTDNPRIQDMVRAEAATNRTLRTALPGMRDTQLFGAPIVSHVTPMQRLLRMDRAHVRANLEEPN